MDQELFNLKHWLTTELGLFKVGSTAEVEEVKRVTKDAMGAFEGPVQAALQKSTGAINEDLEGKEASWDASLGKIMQKLLLLVSNYHDGHKEMGLLEKGAMDSINRVKPAPAPHAILT